MASRPWEELKGQIYLGSDGFIEKHPAPKDLKEIPRVQLRAAKPSLDRALNSHALSGASVSAISP
jgi:hypothetical protein